MERSASSTSPSPYKSFVHFLRSTLHLRPPKHPPSPISLKSPSAVIEMHQPQLPSPSDRLQLDGSFLSDFDANAPSTSASSSQTEVAILYDDPFVCVTSDGLIHIRNYYEFNAEAELRTPTPISASINARQCRRLRASRIQTLYAVRGPAYSAPDPPKNWGLARGGIWWASHASREHPKNTLHNVVVDDGSPIKAGFTVIELRAFVNSIWHAGVPPDCPLYRSLPMPPLSALNLPFIDDDDDEAA